MPKTWLDDALEDALNIEFGELADLDLADLDLDKIEWPELDLWEDDDAQA